VHRAPPRPVAVAGLSPQARPRWPDSTAAEPATHGGGIAEWPFGDAPAGTASASKPLPSCPATPSTPWRAGEPTAGGPSVGTAPRWCGWGQAVACCGTRASGEPYGRARRPGRSAATRRPGRPAVGPGRVADAL